MVMHNYLCQLTNRTRQLDPANKDDLELLLWAVQYMSRNLDVYLEPYAIEAWNNSDGDVWLWDGITLVGVYCDDRTADGIPVLLDPTSGESVLCGIRCALPSFTRGGQPLGLIKEQAI